MLIYSMSYQYWPSIYKRPKECTSMYFTQCFLLCVHGVGVWPVNLVKGGRIVIVAKFGLTKQTNFYIAPFAVVCTSQDRQRAYIFRSFQCFFFLSLSKQNVQLLAPFPQSKRKQK